MSSELIFGSEANASQNLDRLRLILSDAEAILIGAGAGLSTSAGLTYSGERFDKHFADFKEKYQLTDMYSGSFFHWPTQEEYWAYMSRLVFYNRFEVIPGPVYHELFRLVKDRNYFVLTTNVDHQFQLAGFSKERLFYTQGDYGLFQCSVPCHELTYNNEFEIKQMVRVQKDMKIPTDLIPKCPKCGKPMSMNLRADETFVQDAGWHAASKRYSEWVEENKTKKIVLLELGVGFNTPGIIKFPFWRIAAMNPKSTFVSINKEESVCPDVIASRSLLFNDDITSVLAKLH